MSACYPHSLLSRLKHPPSHLHILFIKPSPSRRVPFSTSPHHHLPTKTPPPPRRPIPHKSTSSTSTTPPPPYTSYASSLAAKPHPTLLYTAPSHTLYITSCYSAAAFCLSYAAYNFYHHSLHPPLDLSAWVPVAFGGVCFLMTCLGSWLMLGPARLVRSITALPSPLGEGLKLEIRLRRMFPLLGFSSRRIVVAPEDVGLGMRLYHPVVEKRMTVEERVVARRRAEREHEERMGKSLLTLPIRDGRRAFGGAFAAVARGWSREGFLRLTVRGQAYKLDVTGGWALDDGRALDRLVKVKL